MKVRIKILTGLSYIEYYSYLFAYSAIGTKYVDLFLDGNYQLFGRPFGPTILNLQETRIVIYLYTVCNLPFSHSFLLLYPEGHAH